MRRRQFNQLSLSLAGLGMAACSDSSVLNYRPQTKNPKFRVWWIQSFYPAETEALSQIVAEWERNNNTKVEITFYNDGAINRDTENALNNGNPPDILFSNTAEFALYPKLAWQNNLVDVTDVVEPVKDLFSPIALKAVSYKNGVTNKRSYHAVPIAQLAAGIHYWRDLLADMGLGDTSIPRDWDGFWKFWETAQDRARSRGKKDIYGIGLPMSPDPTNTDTIFMFEQFLEAYGVDLLDDNGQLQIDIPNNREGIIAALTKYAGFYKSGFVPPKATQWTDADNNQVFLSKNSFMTANPGLSIPASQQFDSVVYNKKLVTTEWPLAPSGKPLNYLVAVKQAVIFASSNNQAMAKSLLSHIIQPNNLLTYLKGAGGRYFPTMPKLLEDPYYKDSQDPHILTATKQFQNNTSFYTAQNPAYAGVGADKIWGKAIKFVAQGSATPEQAANTAIAQIKDIFAKWK
ncbi:MAG: carbohydrate ABC transporter substrate-binding protein [Pseudanabaena sp.]|jgi:multiple sugar transport system substrate-binding protein|nr:carbohydrate ABC transporter substrate-binding protein [Pseudanabaena sp. M53BS1SP1A06MG]MCA6581710.1 carbohydrate ABC transporter substrate-binding protein [Pseudanabaena sp. M34BS1SP1A06MG]MCA6591304.1 carbohydrate ABC transporter substrate-binding protein [Pseudanabaena sp. M38BS1SP1A06MG]MCA6595377.1 carbohydrate ABC transporter substrate-binding protein [Pseudanabaena sp. M046S1SP1A06QC]MCA6599558.1 carbohydrate ABC transporter substrate-binding protein [Pseudanabaena sp. M57BS1SP1A06MG